jgi:hypothetical protein
MRSGTVAMYFRRLVCFVKGIVIVHLANSTSQTKIRNSTNTHLVYKNILEFDIPVYIACDLVEVTYSSYNLSKHHAYIIMRE